MRQIEQMESEELLAQKKLRTEVIQLEDMLAQVRNILSKLLKLEIKWSLVRTKVTHWFSLNVDLDL